MNKQKVSDFFGTFLKTEDVTGNVTVTIDETKPQQIGDDSKQKLVVYFKEFDKGLALNKVNADTITVITGTDEFESWTGSKVCLYVDKSVMFGSKKVGGIRIKKVE